MRKYALPIVLAITLVAVLGWGVYQYNEKNDYHTYLDMQFQRQFYELIGHVENAQVNLSKAMVSGSHNDIAKFLNDTAAQSYMAQEKLTQLPFHHGGIRDTERFLSQLGDYSTAMLNKSLEGITLSDDELSTMAMLHEYANEFSQQLVELQQKVVSGGVNFGDLRREGNRDLKRLEEQMGDFNLINFEERMQEYPELIYDGPFSAHLRNIRPRLTGNEITEQQAVDIIANAFEKHGQDNISVTAKMENQSIDGYYVSISNGNTEVGYEATAAVSKTGGKIIWYMDPILTGRSRINREEAIQRAEEFLDKIGYNNMKSTYVMAYEGQIIINFAYEQDGVLVYSDLVKVKVSLDNGDIIGLEAQGYLINHHERNIKKPQMSENEARERLSSAVTEQSVRLAIIPIAGEKEVLTYEFKVKFGEDQYLIYIDANTGAQRKMLLMVTQEDGTLVI